VLVYEISGFHRGAVEVLAPLVRYTEYVFSRLPTFRESLLVSSSTDFLNCLTLDDGADRLDRNTGNLLPPTLPNNPEERGP
jgi:hypothetical protein